MLVSEMIWFARRAVVVRDEHCITQVLGLDCLTASKWIELKDRRARFHGIRVFLRSEVWVQVVSRTLYKPLGAKYGDATNINSSLNVKAPVAR